MICGGTKLRSRVAFVSFGRASICWTWGTWFKWFLPLQALVSYHCGKPFRG